MLKIREIADNQNRGFIVDCVLQVSDTQVYCEIWDVIFF